MHMFCRWFVVFKSFRAGWPCISQSYHFSCSNLIWNWWLNRKRLTWHWHGALEYFHQLNTSIRSIYGTSLIIIPLPFWHDRGQTCHLAADHYYMGGKLNWEAWGASGLELNLMGITHLSVLRRHLLLFNPRPKQHSGKSKWPQCLTHCLYNENTNQLHLLAGGKQLFSLDNMIRCSEQ